MWVYFRHAFYKNKSSAFSERRNSFAHGHRREQIVDELACGEGGRVHGAKCLAVLAGVLESLKAAPVVYLC